MDIFGGHYSAYNSSALDLAVLLAYTNCNLSVIFKGSRKNVVKIWKFLHSLLPLKYVSKVKKHRFKETSKTVE